MSLRFEYNADIPSTYGNSLAQKPRDMQTREKPKPSDKLVLKVKRDE